MDLHSALETYRASVRGRDPLEATQIEFINLDPLRERYGDRWPKVRARIFDVCEAFVNRRIAPGDLALRADSGFLVLPGPGRAEAASVFTARIERELQTFFLGVEHLQSVSVSAALSPLPASALFEALESPGLEAAAAAHEAERPAPCQPVPRKSAGPAEALALPDFSLIFEPVWTAETGFVALHAALPLGLSAAGVAGASGHALAPSQGGAAMRMELDRRVLKAAARVLHARPAGARGVLAAPVHYETLAMLKCRLPYLAAFSALGEDERKSLMAFVRAAPFDAPYSRLTEVCRSAKALFPRVIIEIDLERVKLERFVDARADVFFFTAPGPAPFSARTRDALERLRAGASRLGARVAMGACQDRAQLAAALDVGVHYMSGPVVGARVTAARAPYRLEFDHTPHAAGARTQERLSS
ncbi:MAG: hypothetical protein JJU18_13115 [Oceanicaulis sp.]|nr:hypothetical protein [Oceanicaulis sp.]